MRIFEDNILDPRNNSWNVGRVGIRESQRGWNTNPVPPGIPVPIEPASLLHLGEGWPRGQGGHRLWMDVGTYTTAGSDMLYTGLKLQSPTSAIPWTDQMDAVIGWGDNSEVSPDNMNDLRFIFTVPKSTVGAGDEASEEGLEVARMSHNGFVGIGSFRHPTNPLTPNRPSRRLEVVDRGGETSIPQLRLTFEPDNDQFGGTDSRWTDFEATQNGDLNINPKRRDQDRNVGINKWDPQNTLEINSSGSSPSPSGLRFTNLIASSSVVAGNGKVLSVDSDGDVILVNDDAANVSGFTICSGGSPSNYLMKYNGTSSACSSAVYETASNYVGVGTTIPAAKFHSYLIGSNANLNAGYFELNNTSTAATTSIALSGLVNSSGSTSSNIWAVHGKAVSASGQSVVGGYFLSDGSGTAQYGVSGNANGATGTNYGVNGGAANAGATNNYGVYGRASNASNVNYGIYGAAPQSGTISSSNCAAFFVGDIYGTTGNFSTSDLKFKQNIQPVMNASSILSQLSSKTYEFRIADYPSMNFPSGVQYGLIAQDVEQILPGMVKRFINPENEVNGTLIPEIDFKALNYETLIPILVAAFQEQKHELDSLKTVVANINGVPRPGNDGSQPQQRITLSDQQGIILQQNDPNPFAESTVIRFSIPENVQSARLIFTSMNGAMLKSVMIDSRGDGNLEVFSSDLSSGIYTYTLICDGIVIDSRKMLKD